MRVVLEKEFYQVKSKRLKTWERDYLEWGVGTPKAKEKVGKVSGWVWVSEYYYSCTSLWAKQLII